MTVSICNYICPEAMKDLCMHLDLPEEVTERLVYHVKTMDFKPFDPYFKGLFSLETGAEAVKEISALCVTEEDPTGDTGLKALVVYLAAAQHTHEIYGEKEIDDVVFHDTIKAFTRFVKEHKVSYGSYGFDRHYWIYRQLSANLYRLGTLEFEIVTLSTDTRPIGSVQSGSPVLSVHIPSNAVLTREALDTSYRMAREFFAKYYPDYRYQCVYCSSWLLSPVLKQLLKPGSGILEFQSDYELTHADMESNSGIGWIFKRKYEDFSQLPEDTSLMRAMKRRLLEGGKTGAGTGYVKDFFKK